MWYTTLAAANLCRGSAVANRLGCVDAYVPFLGVVFEPHWEEPIVASAEERIIQIVCDNLGVNKEQVTRTTSFQEDIGADSLDIVELVMELEEEFEITIPDEEAEKIKTVGEAIDYIEKELGKK